MGASARMADSRTQQLRALIDSLVNIVERHGGTVHQDVALREFGEETGLFGPDGFYVMNSAAADYRLTSSLRSGILALTEPVSYPQRRNGE